MGDEIVSFKWSGPKSTWTQEEWDNYHSMPWWMRVPVDVVFLVVKVVGWIRPGSRGKEHG